MPKVVSLILLLVLWVPTVGLAETVATSTKKNYVWSGQPYLPNALSIALGSGLVQIRDRALLPLAHAGMGGQINLGYRRSKNYNVHEAELHIGIYAPRSRIDTGSQHIALGMHYAYLRHMLDLGEFDEKHRKPASLWLGALVGGGPSLQSYPQIDEAHAYWNTSYQLRPVALLHWQAKPRLAWINRLELPTLSVVSRPAAQRSYFNDIPALSDTLALAHSNMQASFAHRVGRLRGWTALEYPLHRRVMQRVAYALDYDYARVGPRFQALTQTLQWQTLWSF